MRIRLALLHSSKIHSMPHSKFDQDTRMKAVMFTSIVPFEWTQFFLSTLIPKKETYPAVSIELKSAIDLYMQNLK